ncbi:MAG: amidohydrolase family protein [Gammaproteobacteria bacterium]
MPLIHARLLIVVAILISNASSAQDVVLENINVVDVINLAIRENQSVVLQDGIITSIYPSKRSARSRKSISLDMTGKFLIPGLIDTHVHHATSPDDADNDEITRMRLRELLRGGVTSVRDMGGDTRVLSSLKRRANADLIQAPDIYYSVIIGGSDFFSDPRTVASAKGRTPGEVDWMRAVNEDTDFGEVISRSQGTGATGVKIYAAVNTKVMAQLNRAAKSKEVKVWSHAYVGPATPIDAVNAGVETLSHASDIASHVVEDFYAFRRQGKRLSQEHIERSLNLNRYSDLLAAMKNNDTILDATLTVFEQTQSERGQRGELLYTWGKTFTRLAHESGIKVSTGTDVTSDSSGTPYPMVHREMQLLVREAGFTPLQAIQSATLIGAEVLGIQDTAGSVQAGTKANLVILNADPSIDIENTLNIAHVIKNGQFVHRGDLPGLPFSSARPAAGMLWMSGQVGNIPSTKVLASRTLEGQMTQAMKNFGPILQEYNLSYEDIVKCTLMLDDIDDWPAANEAYRPFFQNYPARSAYATSGLALGAKVEVECIAEL